MSREMNGLWELEAAYPEPLENPYEAVRAVLEGADEYDRENGIVRVDVRGLSILAKVAEVLEDKVDKPLNLAADILKALDVDNTTKGSSIKGGYRLVKDGVDWDYSAHIEDTYAWRDKILAEEPEAVVWIVPVSREAVIAWKQR